MIRKHSIYEATKFDRIRTNTSEEKSIKIIEEPIVSANIQTT